MTTSTQPTAEVGRRILFTGYGGTTIAHPGVITAIHDDGTLLIRLYGMRSNLRINPKTLPATKSLQLLDEVGPVPALPMGRFQPAKGRSGFEEYMGVLVSTFGEDEVVLVTGDIGRAVIAVNAYLRASGGYDDIVDGDLLPQWAVFEWQPEDADHDWVMDSADEGDDQAIRIYYLPA